MNFLFFFNSALLGAGLAMDAFSVSLANGLHDSKMNKGRMVGIAGTFAAFQYAMPMIGWICVHTIIKVFKSFEKFIPWIALLLLLYIGGSMIIGSLKEGKDEDSDESIVKLGIGTLIIQGIATSIDALSVGFTIADYNFFKALICGLIIAIVTFVICMIGLVLGKKFGTKFAGKAEIFGGIILIGIGIEIFITGVFF